MRGKGGQTRTSQASARPLSRYGATRGFLMDIESILAGKGREVRTIMPDATIAEAVDRMRKEGIGALVVSEDGARIAGIISDRGIMNAISDHGVDVVNEPVHSVMTKEVFTCVPQSRERDHGGDDHSADPPHSGS